MSVRLNHTIVNVKDQRESAGFLSEILGLPEPSSYGPFLVVEVSNEVSLDYLENTDPIHAQHYAFLVDEDEFDEIFARIRDRELTYWADPHKAKPNEINTHDGGRGLYWEEPSGHLLEIITRPYGSGG